MSGSKAMSCAWPLRNIAAVSRTFLLANQCSSGSAPGDTGLPKYISTVTA
jgi:hypothetical protein